MAYRMGRLLLLLTMVGACAASSSTARGSSDVLTHAEITASNATTAFELLQQLRPQFLRSRGVPSMRDPSAGYPVVYMNDVRRGGIDTLRSILVEEVDEIRFFSAADATTRWGTGHAGGVIQVRANY